jgi:hypothetical protein
LYIASRNPPKWGDSNGDVPEIVLQDAFGEYRLAFARREDLALLPSPSSRDVVADDAAFRQKHSAVAPTPQKAQSPLIRVAGYPSERLRFVLAGTLNHQSINCGRSHVGFNIVKQTNQFT